MAEKKAGGDLFRGHEPLHRLHMRRILRSHLLKLRPEVGQLPGRLRALVKSS